jgi:hypothetical protein
MAAKITAFLGLDNSGFRAGVTQSKGMLDSVGTAAVAAGNLISNAITAGARTAANGLRSTVSESISLNANLQNTTATFEVFTKSAVTAKNMVAGIREEAIKNRLSISQMMSAGQMLIPNADGDQAKLMDMLKTATILSKLNPVQGLEGAAYSLREAISGDFISIQERFNISRGTIKKWKDEGLEGLAVVKAALKELGAGPELVNKMADTFDGRRTAVESFFDELKRTAGVPLFESMSNSMAEFLNEMDGGGKERLETFAKSVGSTVGDVFKTAVDGAKQVNWSQVASDMQSMAEAMKATATAASAAVQAARDLPGMGKAASQAAGGVWDWLKEKKNEGDKMVQGLFLDAMGDKDGAAAVRKEALAAKTRADTVAQTKLSPERLLQNFTNRPADMSGAGQQPVTAAEVQANLTRAKATQDPAASAAAAKANADAVAMQNWKFQQAAAITGRPVVIQLESRNATHQIMGAR